MKKTKLAFGIIALSISASASAMPEQVPGRWYANMLFMHGILAGNPGFCKTMPAWWC